MRLGRVDVLAYVKALGLLARNPTLVLAPLAASVLGVLLQRLMPAEAGGGLLGSLNSGLVGLFVQIVNAFGLAVSLILADRIWTRGRARFDDAWDESRRRAPDIILAALGFGFILYVATLVGGMLTSIGALVLGLVALVFFLYALPAASIGGVPGMASLQISLERAQRSLLATILAAVVYIFTYYLLPGLVAGWLLPSLLLAAPNLPWDTLSSIVTAVVEAIAAGYLALILAKAYNDASYGRVY